MTERRQLILAGLLCLGCGLGICLVALRVVPVDEASVHAPDWVILLAGGVFVSAGLAILLRDYPLVVALLGNSIVLSFAVIAAWIAIAGSAEQFSSNLPFLPHDVSVKIARGVFGFSAAVCALILIPGLKQLSRLAADSLDSRR